MKLPALHATLAALEALPAQLRQARRARGLSQRRLALEACVWRCAYQAYEAGRYRPCPAALRRIIEVLSRYGTAPRRLPKRKRGAK